MVVTISYITFVTGGKFLKIVTVILILPLKYKYISIYTLFFIDIIQSRNKITQISDFMDEKLHLI
jgi:hypothetical protein